MSATSAFIMTDRRGSRPANRRMLAACRAVGALFLVSAGIHIGIASAGPQTYRHFADQSPIPLVQNLWSDVFMAHPTAWGFAVAIGELVIGLLILSAGRWLQWGLAAAIGFHVALMLFGFGFWLWSLPMLAVLIAMFVATANLDYSPRSQGGDSS
ncbi:MAG TPA: hypothetical protein VMT88_13660 [Actinomycetes bacterium]|nr:hypothetical protein [Actinomycetes bacterium]